MSKVSLIVFLFFLLQNVHFTNSSASFFFEKLQDILHIFGIKILTKIKTVKNRKLLFIKFLS